MKRTGIISALILLFFMSSCYLTKKQTEYYGVNVKDTKKIVFLLDISGSMEGKAETDLQGNIIGKASNKLGNKLANKVGGIGGKIIRNQTSTHLTKLGKAKQELIPTIRGLSEDVYFTIFVFENRVKSFRKKLIPATSTNKNLAIAYLTKLESGGGTNIHDALEKAFDLGTSAIGIETIFLLSDGSPSAGKTTSRSGIINAVEAWNPSDKVIVNTIGLGEDQDEEFLRKLADQNRGVYIKK